MVGIQFSYPYSSFVTDFTAKFVDCERIEIDTPDGDFLEIDVVNTKK